MINYETYCKIRDCRERQQLTLVQTARALGLNAQTVAKWAKCSHYRARQQPPRSSRLDPFKDRVLLLLETFPYSARQVYRRLLEERVIDRFMKCGDPHHGFARIYCPECRHDYLLAFSCRARYFCPSCHQKRVLAYGDWVEENVLAPVPHRQYVFTVPRLLRPIFSRRRRLLGELCHIVERLLIEAYSGAGAEGRPGLILFVHTFGDLVTFNPHIHVFAADGVFRADGVFVALPAIPVKLLEQGFRSEVLKLLVAEGAIGERLSASMLGWRHSGFSVHNGVRVRSNDAEGRKKLAQYMLRAPFSLEK